MGVQSEMAVVYLGGGRRYLTRRAAARAEARSIIKAQFRASGDDPWACDVREFMAWVEMLARLIERDKPWAVDIGETRWVTSPSLPPTTRGDG